MRSQQFKRAMLGDAFYRKESRLISLMSKQSITTWKGFEKR